MQLVLFARLGGSRVRSVRFTECTLLANRTEPNRDRSAWSTAGSQGAVRGHFRRSEPTLRDEGDNESVTRSRARGEGRRSLTFLTVSADVTSLAVAGILESTLLTRRGAAALASVLTWVFIGVTIIFEGKREGINLYISEQELYILIIVIQSSIRSIECTQIIILCHHKLLVTYAIPNSYQRRHFCKRMFLFHKPIRPLTSLVHYII